MPKTRRKPSWIFILFGALFSVYIGYLAGGAWSEGSNAFIFVVEFAKIMEKPFGNYFNDYTARAIGITLLLYGVVMLMYYIESIKVTAMIVKTAHPDISVQKVRNS